MGGSDSEGGVCKYFDWGSSFAAERESSAAKPVKKARITPTSRINDLEVVIEDLQTRLGATEAQLANIIQLNLGGCQPPDFSSILGAAEERARQREVEQQELVAERKERAAMGHELRAMSDIVTQLWESLRPSMQPTVAPNLLTISKIPDSPRKASLSPSDILARHQQQASSSETEAPIQPPSPMEDSAISTFQPGGEDTACPKEDFEMAGVLNDAPDEQASVMKAPDPSCIHAPESQLVVAVVEALNALSDPAFVTLQGQEATMSPKHTAGGSTPELLEALGPDKTMVGITAELQPDAGISPRTSPEPMREATDCEDPPRMGEATDFSREDPTTMKSKGSTPDSLEVEHSVVEASRMLAEASLVEEHAVCIPSTLLCILNSP